MTSSPLTPSHRLVSLLAALPIALVLAVLVGAAPPAGAHVEPEETEAPAAARVTFRFVVEHGCESSPTTEVAIQVPEGSFDVVPLPPTGWTSQLIDEETVVTFQGGPLDAETPETFSVELVTPNLPGVTVLFPTVQTCVDGEIAWIDPDPEGEEPAPRLRLTENPNPILPTTSFVPSTTAPDGEATTTSSTIEIVTSAPEPDDGDDDGDGTGGPMIWVVVAALAAAGAYVAFRRRR